jgi:hypothetical protein
MLSSFFILNHCSGSMLAKNGDFASNWPLARAKFAAVFLMFLYGICSVWQLVLLFLFPYFPSSEI